MTIYHPRKSTSTVLRGVTDASKFCILADNLTRECIINLAIKYSDGTVGLPGMMLSRLRSNER